MRMVRAGDEERNKGGRLTRDLSGLCGALSQRPLLSQKQRAVQANTDRMEGLEQWSASTKPAGVNRISQVGWLCKRVIASSATAPMLLAPYGSHFIRD